MDAESPHILVNASTGGGKSVILRCVTCQMVHNGSLAFVLDYKRISHSWARGIRGVTYCADIADIHDALIQLGMEGRRRVRVADELGMVRSSHCAIASVMRCWLGRAGSISKGTVLSNQRRETSVVLTASGRAAPSPRPPRAGTAVTASTSSILPISMSPLTTRHSVNVGVLDALWT
ncbi:hypothetical protein ACIHCQ_35670 [Streptomyces sp. NPDC052236]|uniref:hypothetical protein n=1 Tax=Streptomyces sp. NPDC052236 TaxID=3365686 RepID=UPI0037D87887